jgi:small GTP-binding protein
MASQEDDWGEVETKVVVIGRTTVGKTSIVGYIITGDAPSGTQPTIGADFAIKTFEHNGKQVHVQIWDTAGHERYRALTPLYYRGAKIACIVYAVDDSESFDEIDYWHRSLTRELGSSFYLILVANKIDLTRVVTAETGQAKAEAIHAHYLETSAISGLGMKELFAQIADGVLEVESQVAKVKNPVQLIPNEPQESSCC